MADRIPEAVPDTSILTAAELDSIRRPYRGARLLPRKAYHEPAIFDWERENVLRRDWVIVGRVDEAPDPGTYFLTELDGEPLLVVRGRENELRAFYNVASTAARRSSKRRVAPRSASSARTTPGSTISRAS